MTLHNGLSNILQYVQSHLRRPGDVEVDDALRAIEKMAQDTLFTAEEELEGVPKDDLGDAIKKGKKNET